MATLTTQNLHAAAMLSSWLPEAASTLACTKGDGSNDVVLALGFVAPNKGAMAGTPRFNDVRFYVSAVSGSPTVTAELYANSASNTPGTLIETGSVTCSPTAAGWWTCSGFTTTSNLTEGTQYWIVLSCTAGTSATIRWFISANRGGNTATSPTTEATNGCLKVHSTTNKSTWAGTASASICGWRCSFTDGTDTIYYGLPIYDFTAASASTEKLYTNGGNVQEFGTLFAMLGNAAFKLRSVLMYARKNSSPTGNLRCRLYTGTSLTATSVAIATQHIASGGAQHRFGFSTPQTLLPGVAYRIVLGNSAADDSSNYYYTYKFMVDNDATSRTLMPFATIQSTRLSGSSWAELNTEYVPFVLIGDTDGQFAAPEFPAVGDVQTGSGAFGWDNEFTPTCDLPTVGQVQSGVGYGASGTEFTGTLSAGGGRKQLGALRGG